MRDLTPSCPDRDFPAAPLRMSRRQVLPEWIDYNGHMNVSYYTLAFDQAFDEFLEDYIGIGASYVARSRFGPMSLQQHIHYVGELLEDQGFFVDIRVIDADQKRIHLYGEMIAEEGEALAAVFEGLSINVDLDARRSAAYPDFAADRMARLIQAQSALPRPSRLGQPLGIRR